MDGSIIYQTVPYETPKGTLEYPLRIAEGSYFLLNDYRENRNDSRSFGAIPEEDITGVVIFTMQYRGF